MPPKGGSSGSVRKPQPAAAARRDEVVPMTTQLFAAGTKNVGNTAQDQQRLLHDLLVLVRHGERQDHIDKWKGNTLLPLYDPPLSSTGRKQSLETALEYRALQQEKSVERRIQGTFSVLLVSPFHRCLETALIINLVAFGGSLAMFVDPQLSDWQQPKVFRVAPTLGGHYALEEQRQQGPSKPNGAGNGNKPEGGEAATTLVFRPQREALRAALEPFFQARAKELLLDATTMATPAAAADSNNAAPPRVTPEAAQRWGADLREWLDGHAALPVWTSATTEADLRQQLTEVAVAEPAKSSSNTAPRQVAGGRSATPTAAAPVLSRCGTPHPESRSDLVRRCQQVEQTHFLASVASLAQVPAAVRVAVAKEQRERLPKYFQTLEQRPEATCAAAAAAGPAALLPPMHVMAVTHADIVASMIEACCPKHLGDNSGKSVPYCSLSVLRRHNNYYRIPPPEERPAATAAAASGCGGKGRGRGGGRGQSNPRGGGGLSLAPRDAAGSAAEELPLDWRVDAVGSTDLLVTTRVVLRFN